MLYTTRSARSIAVRFISSWTTSPCSTTSSSRTGTRTSHTGSTTADSGLRNTWCGLAFERVCLEHVPQIKRALGISGVLTEVCSWSCKADADDGICGSQIDLVIARRDHVINFCEMKYAQNDFAVTKSGDDELLRHKMADFRRLTKSRDALHITMICLRG